MNKRGFTLIELLATIVIIALIMSIILPSASRMSRENKETIYHSYEEMMVEYAQVSEYKDQDYINLNDLAELEKVKRECNGYVLIDHDISPASYKAYISCGNSYETDGYIDIETGTGGEINVPTCLSNVVYNGKQQSLVQSNILYKLSNNMRRNYGKQNVIVSLANKIAYKWSDGTVEDKIINDCEIKKRQITLTAEDKTIRYEDPVPVFTYTLTGNVSGENPIIDNVKYVIKNSGGTTITDSNFAVGTYTINPSTTVSNNYNLVYGDPATFKVLQNKFTLTLNNQGATTDGTSKIYEKYNVGWYSDSNYTNTIASITIPAKAGNDFEGYYSELDGSGTELINSTGVIIASNTFMGEEDTTAYAKWEPKTYTITLNNQSATTEGTKTIYEKYNTGWYSNSEATTAITTITKPVKDGYTFGGYYTLEDGEGTQIIDSTGKIVGSNTSFTANTTIYAKWTQKTYTITLENQSATTEGTKTIYEKYNAGYYSNSGATSAITSITKPAKTGYVFKGYYTAENGGGTQVISANGAISASNNYFSANTTVYAKWEDNTYTININKNGSACTDCSGYAIHLSTSSSSDTNSYSATTTTASKVTISFKSESKYYIWIGKDQNHKSTMVYSGVEIEGNAPTATVNYYTLKMTGTNMATLTLNGSSVTSGNSVLVAGTSGNSHTLGGTVTTNYTFTTWSKVSGTVTFASATTVSSGLKVSANSEIKATAEDQENPTVTLTSTATLKATSQTATLKCTDNIAVTAYYWGTTEPTAETDITTTTAADITSLKSSSGLSKSITSNGSFWLACRDAKGNFAKKRIIMRKYVVKNMLVTYSGTIGTYSTDNYEQASTGTYYIPNGTELTVASIYTVPTGSRTGRYRGYSTGAPSETAVTLSSGNPTISANTTYAFWFSRNVVNFKYKTNGGTVKSPTTNGTKTYTWTVDGDGFINRSIDGAAATVLTSSYRYGVENIDLPSPVNSSGLLILKSGKWVTTNSEWTCISGCTTANLTISQASIAYDSSTMCNITSADCTLIIQPRFVNCPANNYCTGSDAMTSCGDNKSSLAGSTSSSDCFTTVTNFSYTGNIQTYTVPTTGTYKLEVWGAQGGGGSSTGNIGGKGGHSYGNKELTKGTKIYIGVGGKGSTNAGGYNGGGSGTADAGPTHGKGGGGGGASHMAITTNRGVLSKYSSNKSEVLIVAGGGGGAAESARSGGVGGGTKGGDGQGGMFIGKGGTQTAAGARGDTDCTNGGFGYGGSSASGSSTKGTYGSGGGGGGYYGGGASSHKSGGGSDAQSSGGGGSGYIGGVTNGTTESGTRLNNGYARITWVGA